MKIVLNRLTSLFFHFTLRNLVRLLKKFVVNVDKTHDCVFFPDSINEHSFDTCLDHSSFTGYHLRPLKMVENHSDEGNNNKQVHRKFLGKRSI